MSSSEENMQPVVLAITGASGAVYAARLLEALLCERVPVHLTLSDSGAAVVKQEFGISLRLNGENIQELWEAGDKLLGVQPAAPVSAVHATQAMPDCLEVHHYKDYFTPIASGSFLTQGMVICPCSGSTLSGIAHASSNNLIQRAADVHLKESRKLILVPRETPLSSIQLGNMYRLSQSGVVILPAAPGWYHGVSGLLDLVDFVVARVLDQLSVPNNLMQRWGKENPTQNRSDTAESE